MPNGKTNKQQTRKRGPIQIDNQAKYINRSDQGIPTE